MATLPSTLVLYLWAVLVYQWWNRFWVRRVWNGSADPKSRQIRGAFRHTISQRKSESPAEIHKKIVAVYVTLWIGKIWRRKKHLAGNNFDDDDDVQEEVMTWFKG